MSLKNRPFESVKRKSPFNYDYVVLSELLDGYLDHHKNIPSSLVARLVQLKHDIDFVYNAEPEWLEKYDIENSNIEIIYSLKRYI